jgi:hypothetical protein
MLVHKFGRKPQQNLQLLTVTWKPDLSVTHKPRKKDLRTWEIFCQEEILIKPSENKAIQLKFGVGMSAGMLITSLSYTLKLMLCSIQNETTFESVSDVIISLQNNSRKEVILSAGQQLCFIHYVS